MFGGLFCARIRSGLERLTESCLATQKAVLLWPSRPPVLPHTLAVIVCEEFASRIGKRTSHVATIECFCPRRMFLLLAAGNSSSRLMLLFAPFVRPFGAPPVDSCSHSGSSSTSPPAAYQGKTDGRTDGHTHARSTISTPTQTPHHQT